MILCTYQEGPWAWWLEGGPGRWTLSIITSGSWTFAFLAYSSTAEPKTSSTTPISSLRQRNKTAGSLSLSRLCNEHKIYNWLQISDVKFYKATLASRFTYVTLSVQGLIHTGTVVCGSTWNLPSTQHRHSALCVNTYTNLA